MQGIVYKRATPYQKYRDSQQKQLKNDSTVTYSDEHLSAARQLNRPQNRSFAWASSRVAQKNKYRPQTATAAGRSNRSAGLNLFQQQQQQQNRSGGGNILSPRKLFGTQTPFATSSFYAMRQVLKQQLQQNFMGDSTIEQAPLHSTQAYYVHLPSQVTVQGCSTQQPLLLLLQKQKNSTIEEKPSSQSPSKHLHKLQRTPTHSVRNMDVPGNSGNTAFMAPQLYTEQNALALAQDVYLASYKLDVQRIQEQPSTNQFDFQPLQGQQVLPQRKMHPPVPKSTRTLHDTSSAVLALANDSEVINSGTPRGYQRIVSGKLCFFVRREEAQQQQQDISKTVQNELTSARGYQHFREDSKTSIDSQSIILSKYSQGWRNETEIINKQNFQEPGSIQQDKSTKNQPSEIKNQSSTVRRQNTVRVTKPAVQGGAQGSANDLQRRVSRIQEKLSANIFVRPKSAVMITRKNSNRTVSEERQKGNTDQAKKGAKAQILALPPSAEVSAFELTGEEANACEIGDLSISEGEEGTAAEEGEGEEEEGEDAATLAQAMHKTNSTQIRLLNSIYQGRPPTVFFQYPQICALTRDTTRSVLVSQKDALRYELTFKMGSVNRPFVCVTGAFEEAGFEMVTSGCDWNGFWGGRILEGLKKMNRYQKTNHFPGTWNLGRKDLLWMKVSKMKRHFPDDFKFVPNTFLLGCEWERFLNAMEEKKNKSLWIIKPVANACGRGIRLWRKKQRIHNKKNYLASEYISRPHLINGYKYDLRLYVLITSFDPLRIYLYGDGLARFATEKYDTKKANLSQRFVHLTNYSINKHSKKFVSAKDTNDTQATKWTLKTLQIQLERDGIDFQAILERIKDCLVKTCIAVEPFMLTSINKTPEHRTNCFELYGFDVLLDESLQPWLLECNVCPSLSSPSPLDLKIKTTLLSDVLNLVGFTPYDKKQLKLSKRKPGMPVSTAGLDERAHAKLVQHLSDLNEENCLDKLSSDDWEVLFESEEENHRRGHFERIFPLADQAKADYYAQFFEFPRYKNILLQKCLAADNRYLEKICKKISSLNV